MKDFGMISLRGGVNGVLKYRGENGSFELELALRRRTPGRLTVCVLSPDGSAAFCDITPGRADRINVGGVCGAAVFDADARLLCRGSAGGCSIDRRLGEIRIMAASRIKRSAEARESAPTAEASPVTSRILEKARELFAPLSEMSAAAERESEADKTADGDAYAVPNPFPRTYPNSYWRMQQGDSAVYGYAVTARGKLSVTAVPGRRKRRPYGFGRFLIDVNGKGMWVKERMV